MNSIKTFFRYILRNKIFSFITISSLAISLSVILLLSSFLISELKYDKHIEDIESIYRIGNSMRDSQVPELAKSEILENLPEVITATNYMVYPDPVVYNGHTFDIDIIHTDEDFFELFNIQLLSGHYKGVFNNPNNVIISKSLSEKIFGSEDPIGKSLNISHNSDVYVAGIIEDFPKQSILSGDIICSTDLKIRYSRSCGNGNCSYFYKTLVKMNGDNSPEFSEKLTKIIAATYTINSEENITYSLYPYKGAYFDTTLLSDNLKHANISLIRLLVILTFILLGLSIFNFINLSLSQITKRNKEFGVKQVLGAGYYKVFFQFFKESFLTIIIAFIIGISLSFMVKPVFESILGKEIFIMDTLSSPVTMLFSLFFLVILASICAFYPALAALKFKPKDILQGHNKTMSTDFNFRSVLNIFQYAASIAVIIGLITITRQIDYVKNKDLGFSTEQLVRIPVHWKAMEKVDVLKSKLQSVAGVENVCYSHGTPGSIWNYSSNDEFGNVSVITSDFDFIKTFDLNIMEGRNFYPDEKKRVCLINEKVMKQAGWDDIHGKRIFGAEVVGVVDEFHFKDLYNEIGGLMIQNGKDVSHITIRFNQEDISGIMENIERGFKEVLPDFNFNYEFYDDFFDGMYKQEEKRATAIRIISIIAIFITCIGLYGSVEFSARNRIKEIGIRKVNGARVPEVMILLNKDFSKLFVIAFVISCPLSYYFLNNWLNTFKYKISLNWYIFILGGLSMLLIALFTVSWRTWKAAKGNPVKALKYE